MVVTAAIGEALVFFVFKKKNRIPLQARSVQRIEREALREALVSQKQTKGTLEAALSGYLSG